MKTLLATQITPKFAEIAANKLALPTSAKGRHIGLPLLLLALALAFFGCSSEDNGEPDDRDKYIGTWNDPPVLGTSHISLVISNKEFKYISPSPFNPPDQYDHYFAISKWEAVESTLSNNEDYPSGYKR